MLATIEPMQRHRAYVSEDPKVMYFDCVDKLSAAHYRFGKEMDAYVAQVDAEKLRRIEDSQRTLNGCKTLRERSLAFFAFIRARQEESARVIDTCTSHQMSMETEDHQLRRDILFWACKSLTGKPLPLELEDLIAASLKSETTWLKDLWRYRGLAGAEFRASLASSEMEDLVESEKGE